jgi:hypothetical protein
LSVSRPMRGGGIELLGHRHKRDALRVENLDHLGEICQRSGQPVDLVHDHDVNQAMADVFEQPLQCRPLHGPAGHAAIIVGCLDESPAFALLALDECFAGLALGMQRIEVLLQTFFRRLPRVDRAAADSVASALHRLLPWPVP